MIIADSREKNIAHILKYFDKHGIEYTVRKLDVGDYMIDGQPDVVVDRKQSLGEMTVNMFSKDKARFYREIRRAREQGIRLIILCEQGRKFHNITDVAHWTNKYSRVSGPRLADAIFKLEMGYGVETYFCEKQQTGRRIIELLTGNDGKGGHAEHEHRQKNDSDGQADGVGD